jgi:hypothetical protein
MSENVLRALPGAVYCLLLAANSAAHTPMRLQPRELTITEAGTLVRLAVEKQTEQVHPKGAFSLDKFSPEPDERFYSFQAIGVWSRQQGSAVLGTYSVNRTTAEVWNMFSCEVVEFPKLFKVQTRYRNRMGLHKESATHQNSSDRPSLCG